MGRARKVAGRSACISINGPVKGDKIISVTTIGKEDPTFAELIREDIILKALQHETNIFSIPFFQALWLPHEQLVWPPSKGQKTVQPVQLSRGLNPSQLAAVERILSDEDDDRIVVIHGPPGTGKTTVIAASVISHDRAKSSRGIWVAAQSNVAVKNIAEKFIKEGFDGFRILVTWDFHFDWYVFTLVRELFLKYRRHEHLYEKIEPLLIRSDSFPESIVGASKQLLDCTVILCTLSMFSNLKAGVYLTIVPPEIIILDEASQIECMGYLPIFHQFHSKLAKLVFIGDNKQCDFFSLTYMSWLTSSSVPPYGQEDIPELRSIFEFSHLRRRALFLNMQCLLFTLIPSPLY